MKLLVLGGHDRMKGRIKELSKRYGLDIRFINQETQQNIDNVLACADWIIIFTGIVGHNMVKLAKSYAKERCMSDLPLLPLPSLQGTSSRRAYPLLCLRYL